MEKVLGDRPTHLLRQVGHEWPARTHSYMRSRSTGPGLEWAPVFQPRALLASPMVSESELRLALDIEKHLGGMESFPPGKLFLFMLASPRCSGKGQKYLFSLILWGSE